MVRPRILAGGANRDRFRITGTCLDSWLLHWVGARRRTVREVEQTLGYSEPRPQRWTDLSGDEQEQVWAEHFDKLRNVMTALRLPRIQLIQC